MLNPQTKQEVDFVLKHGKKGQITVFSPTSIQYAILQIDTL